MILHQIYKWDFKVNFQSG